MSVPEALAALLDTAGVVDYSSHGRLWITGPDALDLLNRLTTNKLDELPAGQYRATVVTNGDGRVIDLVHLGGLENSMSCITSPGQAETVVDWLDTFTFGEEIEVVDRTASTFHLALAGPRAVDLLHQLGAPDLAAGGISAATIAGAQVELWRGLPGGADGYEIIGNAADREAVLNVLVQQGASPVDDEAWEAYRVLNGMPVLGAEFGLFANPLEARLDWAISDDKGCYTGQEVIARLQTYQKVQRQLMSVTLSRPAAPGAKLTAEGKTAGGLTSVVELPDRVVGLALVSAKQAAAGTTLDVVDENGEQLAEATLSDPPYLAVMQAVQA